MGDKIGKRRERYFLRSTVQRGDHHGVTSEPWNGRTVGSGDRRGIVHVPDVQTLLISIDERRTAAEDDRNQEERR